MIEKLSFDQLKRVSGGAAPKQSAYPENEHPHITQHSKSHLPRRSDYTARSLSWKTPYLNR